MTDAADLILLGGTVLTMDPSGTIVEDAAIEIKEGVIRKVAPADGYHPSPGVKVLDTRRCLVLPGLVNGHTHAGMTLLRGIADDFPLHRWLHEAIFPLEKKWGSPDFVYTGTLLAAVEMIRAGTTTINDMYYYEEAAAKACHEAGLRAICGQTVVEISGVEKGGADPFARLDGFLEAIAVYPLISPAVTPHSIYGVSDATWKRIIEYVDKKGVVLHTHLAETQEEEDQCQKRYGLTPTEYFDRLGLWSKKAIAAHATCVTPTEIAILGNHRVGIVHNPESNLKLGTRICPVVELRAAGCRVALGTDGTASGNNLDLLQEADTAAKLQSYRKGVGSLDALSTVRLLTSEGAAALGLDDRIGSLEVGKAADLIAVDLQKAHLLPLYNPYSHLVYCANGADVKHSVVNGRVLMENYRLTTLDEASILQEATRWGKRIAEGLRGP